MPYNLDESKNWGTSLSTIKESYEKATAEGVDVRAIVIINPGNPTGASLSEADVRAVIEFACEKHLVLMADEVYQTNVSSSASSTASSVYCVSCRRRPPANMMPWNLRPSIRSPRAW